MFGPFGFAMPFQGMCAFRKELLSLPGLSLQGVEVGQSGQAICGGEILPLSVEFAEELELVAGRFL